VGARFSAPVQTGPGAHPASCTMGTGPFLGVKSGWGVTLTPHLILVPRSKNRAIPLRSLRAFEACKKAKPTYLVWIVLFILYKHLRNLFLSLCINLLYSVRFSVQFFSAMPAIVKSCVELRVKS
jgi:hypothetical protein